MIEVVKYLDSKISHWYRKSMVRHHNTYKNVWDEKYYASREDAVIAMLMSFALCCRNNPTEMLYFLRQSPIGLYCSAMDLWTEEVMIDLVECACFTRTTLHESAHTVVGTMFFLPDVHTIQQLVSITDLSVVVVKNVLTTLVKKGFIEKVSRGSYMLIGSSKVVYFLKQQLTTSYYLLLYISLTKKQLLSTLQLGDVEVVIDDTAKVVLLESHPHFYPWVASPARQKIFCKESIPPTQEKIFSNRKKGEQGNAMVTMPVGTQSLEIWGPIEYDIPSFLMHVCGAPEHISQGFETVKICCPDPFHNDSNPSCTVFAAGNAYCHSCHRKFRDIRELASCFVDTAFYADDWIATEEAICDVLAPYMLNGGKLDPNTVTYQHITQRSGQGILQYELDAMRERYNGVFKNGDSHYGHNWQDLSRYSQAQYELFTAGYSIATLEDWHVYTFDLDHWFKIRVPLVHHGMVVGEQAISTQTDRGRGAGKYFTTPGLEKSKYVYGMLDTADSACMVVEGLKDCFRVYQRGFKNVCTTLGSSMSDEQADYLAKHFKLVFLAYDNDRAGRQGYREAYDKLIARNVKVQQVVYAAKDPDLCPIAEWRCAVIKACANASYFTPSAVWDYGV